MEIKLININTADEMLNEVKALITQYGYILLAVQQLLTISLLFLKN